MKGGRLMPYRTLRDNEIVKRGDRVLFDNDDWVPVNDSIGRRVSWCRVNYHALRYRRPLKAKVVAKTAANKRSRKRAARFRRVR
jgi:hypothetical protein